MSEAVRSRGALELAAFAILAVGVLFLAIHDLSILFFPHDLIYGEGFVLRDAAMLRDGKSPYTPVAALPAVVANYPPVYPAATAIAMIALGKSFLAGRAVSILATVGCAVFVWRIARRAGWRGGAGLASEGGHVAVAKHASGSTARGALFAPLLFLADIVIYYWSPYARVDMLALALELAALDAFHDALVKRGGDEAPARAPDSRLIRGLALSVLAVFTRPTAVAAPVALVIAFAFARDVRRAAILGGAFVVATLVAGFALNAATSGEFLRHTVAYNANTFRWGELPSLILDFVTPHAPLFLGAAAFFVMRGASHPDAEPSADRSDAGGTLLAAYFVCACALALLVGKVGSSANYFLQAVAAAAILFSIALCRASSDSNARRLLLLAACAGPLLFATVPFSRTLELRMNPFPAMGRTPGNDDRSAGDEVMAIVRDAGGEVLIEDAGFLVRAGKRVWASPLQLAYLEEQGLYEPAPLAAMIRRHEFAAIILSYNFFSESPALRAAIGEAYRPERVIEIPRRYKYIVLRPAAGTG